MKKMGLKSRLFLVLSIVFMHMYYIPVNAGGDEIEIKVEESYQMHIGESGETVKFSPTEDGWYKFYTTGEYNTYATLYNSNWDIIDVKDDTNDDFNFHMKLYLYSGYTYYLEVYAYKLENGATAKFELIVESAVGVEEVEVTKEPDNTTVIKGFEAQTIYCDGLEAIFTLSDGTKVEWAYSEDNTVGDSQVYVYIDDDGYEHYYIEIVCEEAYTKFFFDTIEPTAPTLLTHYRKDGNSVIDLYLPEKMDIIAAFADYENKILKSINCVPVEVSEAAVVSVISENKDALGEGDKIMLVGSINSMIPLCNAYTVE